MEKTQLILFVFSLGIFLPGVLRGQIPTPTVIPGSCEVSTGSLSYDGLDDYVNVPNSLALNPSSAITMEGWFKPLSTNNARVMGKHYPYAGYAFSINPDAFTFGIENTASNTGQVSSATTPVIGEWFHLAGTFDGSVLKLYINGTFEASTDLSSAIGTTGNPFTIGNYYTWSSLPPGQYFKGLIDDVSIYNVALDAAQIWSIYHNKSHPVSSLVARWNFNEGSGTTASDSAGDNDGTIHGPAWATDHRPNAPCATPIVIPTPSPPQPCEPSTGSLSFDGIDDYATLFFNVDETLPFSISAWVYLDQYRDLIGPFPLYGGNVIFSRGNSCCSGQWDYIFNVNGHHKLGFVTHPEFCCADTVEAEDDFPLGGWVFVTFTHEGLTGKLYQDGQLVGINDNMRPGNNHNESPTVIGASWNSDYGYDHECTWDGFIDDLAVYNQALTQEEIAGIYTSKSYPSHALVYHWSCNEGNGVTIGDSTSGNDGTLHGPAWATDHRPNAPCATPTPPPLPVIDSGDYNGDGISDVAIFRSAYGLWAVRELGGVYFGSSGDIPASGDYNGDGTAEITIFRPSAGLWAIRNFSRIYFGKPDDISVPADYDGDGICDVGIFRPSSGLWALREISRIYYGGGEDRSIPGDYNGDGSTEVAIFRPTTGLWSIYGYTRYYFGARGDIPVPGYYNYFSNGEDSSVFRPATGQWIISKYLNCYFGQIGDFPVPADFNGDSFDDIAIFRPSTGLWFIRGKSQFYYGNSNDIPVTR